MLNWNYGCLEHPFWGDWAKSQFNLWKMKNTQAWQEDFLSTTTQESPMPIGYGGVLCPTGIASTEAFGQAKLNLTIVSVGSASAEVCGTPNLGGAVYLVVTGIASEEAHGTPKLVQALVPIGILTAEAIGTLKLNLAMALPGIVSQESFGDVHLSQSLAPTGIVSGEALGTPKLAQILAALGIISGEAFGSSKLNTALVLSGVVSGEAFGVPVIVGGGTPSDGNGGFKRMIESWN